jgi:hypothetical protein
MHPPFDGQEKEPHFPLQDYPFGFFLKKLALIQLQFRTTCSPAATAKEILVYDNDV